ncbi:uncharacterized protein CTRU02_204436 [Colletotrichum truncatum]|uniref:Uncharacterized protein n=1 Tax=Colletotrichum truncatum TaxID=5467 RepID=A0ACC3ZCM2_COLTU|nr:uncharacterized protein CTRU02_14419 [Colletotrichum truncatum]KAF6782232.1 hypothetical protein CTRU02_14419 [Colletotrichum truncatum]
MKATFFTLVFGLSSAALAQQQFRCRCADGNDNNVPRIGDICTSKGGQLEQGRDDLCIKIPSKFTNEDCAKVQQGSRGDCIDEPTGGGSTVVVTATAAKRALQTPDV